MDKLPSGPGGIWTSCGEHSALADVESLLSNRKKLASDFNNRPGWRLVIEATDSELFNLRGFDPLNSEIVENGVLHTRFLKLGNASGSLELLGGEALTVGAGGHPSFQWHSETDRYGARRKAAIHHRFRKGQNRGIDTDGGVHGSCRRGAWSNDDRSPGRVGTKSWVGRLTIYGERSARMDEPDRGAVRSFESFCCGSCGCGS